MRRTGMWLSVLAMVVCAGNASAFITADGNWNDWFTYNGDVNNEVWEAGNYTVTNLNIRARADEEGATPGVDIQEYDIEEVVYVFDDTDSNALTGGTLYVGLVTGFPGIGINHSSGDIFAGDLFLGLGGSGDLNIGIGVGQEAANAARYGQAYAGDSTHWIDPVPGPFLSSRPWRMDEGTALNVTAALNPTVGWGSFGEHYFLEVGITLDGIQEEQITNASGGLSVHWTMGCGNDVITFTDDNPFVPVPEPATVVLLGMGALGIALRSKRPQC